MELVELIQKWNLRLWYGVLNQKYKQISQPNNHEDEVEECHVQERLATINK